MKTVFRIAFALIVTAAIGAVAFVWSGVYDASVTGEHTQPVYSLLERTMRQSVRLRARGLEPPDLGDPARVERGALCYRAKCLQCHGGPGVAPGEIGRSMQPLPGPLVDTPMRWRARELYWITRHGIKMSGMPAWQHHLSDDDLWAVVAFVVRMPALSPADFGAVMAGAGERQCLRPEQARSPGVGDAARGRAALRHYACNSCHVIPGVTGADVRVGPPLEGIGTRSLIAGAVANIPEQLVRWIRDPQSIDPLTAMPNLGVSERDAHDIAAYLATLR